MVTAVWWSVFRLQLLHPCVFLHLTNKRPVMFGPKRNRMKTQIRNNRVNLLLINNIHREDKTGLTLSQWRSEHSVLETELFSSAAARLGLEP